LPFKCFSTAASSPSYIGRPHPVTASQPVAHEKPGQQPNSLDPSVKSIHRCYVREPYFGQQAYLPKKASEFKGANLYSNGLKNPSVDLPLASNASLIKAITPAAIGAAHEVPSEKCFVRLVLDAPLGESLTNRNL
jgi:hypothetical protein